MENPTWVDKLSELQQEVNTKTPSSKEEISVKNNPKIILSPRKKGLLWFEMLSSINKIKSQKGIIPFPSVFEKICRKFSITKSKAWNCLFFLAEFDLIEIVRSHGIKLKYNLQGENDN